VVAGGATTGDDLEALLVQALADGGSNATHAARDICNFLTHVVCSSEVLPNGIKKTLGKAVT
jgi:hypothetical protein